MPPPVVSCGDSEARKLGHTASSRKGGGTVGSAYGRGFTSQGYSRTNRRVPGSGPKPWLRHLAFTMKAIGSQRTNLFQDRNNQSSASGSSFLCQARRNGAEGPGDKTNPTRSHKSWQLRPPFPKRGTSSQAGFCVATKLTDTSPGKPRESQGLRHK